VQFVVRHDKKKKFLFATLQSEAGRKALEHYKESRQTHGSVILFYRGKYYDRSGAALWSLRLLGGIWQLFYTFIIVPPFVRNIVYDFVARNRYKWFGKSEHCMIPTPELKSRFIEE
jgi:predicted DCC family thiol-disulfide oxidoreductase YuxK